MKPLPQKPEWNEVNPDIYYVRASQFYNSARALGYPNIPAIGLMVTQPDMEAGFRSDLRGDGGKAYNAIQWHEPRITNIKIGTGIDVETETSIPRIVAAIDWELKHTHTLALSLILAARSVEQAAEEASKYYEGAGALDAAARRGQDGEWWTTWFTRNHQWVEGVK